MRSVFLFNPTCEMAIVNDTVSYMPPAHLRKFESNIAPIMGFAGDSNDHLLLEDNNKVAEFCDFMGEVGFDLPKVFDQRNMELWPNGKIETLSPWGWSRAAHRIITPLKKFCSNRFVNSPVYKWEQTHREFFSRRTSVAFLHKFKEKSIVPDYISIPYTPVIISSYDQVQKYMSENKPSYVFKTPWSSSGRGLYPVLSEQFIARSEVWVKSRLKQQKELIVEPWLKKVLDFSFQFYIHSNGEIDFLGVNYFEAGEEGKFEREYVGFPQGDMYDAVQKKLPVGWVSEIKNLLIETMYEQRFEKHYCGPAGIDGIIFLDEDEVIRIHPCIEINFRYNMGLLNLNIGKKLHPDAVGGWKIKQFKPGEWNAFVKQNINKHPIQRADNKVISGFLPLVPYSGDQLFGAWTELL